MAEELVKRLCRKFGALRKIMFFVNFQIEICRKMQVDLFIILPIYFQCLFSTYVCLIMVFCN